MAVRYTRARKLFSLINSFEVHKYDIRTRADLAPQGSGEARSCEQAQSSLRHVRTSALTEELADRF